MRFTPVDYILGNSFQIHACIDNQAGTISLLHLFDKRKQPSLLNCFHTSSNSKFLTDESADNDFIFQHMYPANDIIHAIFAGKDPQLVFGFESLIDLPETYCHEAGLLPAKIGTNSTKTYLFFRLSDYGKKVYPKIQ